MLIELHILQNFSPSCLNRDDLNAPKDCEFGGVRRARISSQSLKRAARWNEDFVSTMNGHMGTRSRRMQDKMREKLAKSDRPGEECDKVAEAAVLVLAEKFKLDKEGDRTQVALYLDEEEIAGLSEFMLENFDELLDAHPLAVKLREGKKVGSKDIPDVIKNMAKSLEGCFKKSGSTKAADIALFGRMIAEIDGANVDAAAQVAHAISTHAVPSEFDFFTAVDDLQPKSDPGAGMMGTQQFNSATFYRYANVHLHQLAENLHGDNDLAREAALAFVHSFITAIPAAKQNSHAALNPPDAVLAVVRRKGQPISLANAFVKPVGKNVRSGLVAESAERLADYWARIRNAYFVELPAGAPYYSVPSELDSMEIDGGERVSGLAQLLDRVREALKKSEEEDAQ